MPSQSESIEDLCHLLDDKAPNLRLEASRLLAVHYKSIESKHIPSLLSSSLTILIHRCSEFPGTRADILRCLNQLVIRKDADETFFPPLLALKDLRLLVPALMADIRSGVRSLHTCGCPGCTSEPKTEMQRCSGCKMAWFCSPACAKTAWTTFGHRAFCNYVTKHPKQVAQLDPRGNAKDDDLAFLSSAMLANLTRSEAFMTSESVQDELASAAGEVAHISLDCKMPKDYESAAMLLDLLNNLSRSSRVCDVLFSREKSGQTLLASLVSTFLTNAKSGIFLPMKASMLTMCRNMCMDRSLHKFFVPSIATSSGCDLVCDLPVVFLQRLRGDTIFSEGDKKNMPPELTEPGKTETNEDIRKLALEGLLLLSCYRPSRADLITRKAYPVLRDYEKTEKDEELKKKVSEIVDFLSRASKGDGDCPIAIPIENTDESDDSKQETKQIHELPSVPTDVPEVDPTKVMKTRSDIEKPAVPAVVSLGSVTKEKDTEKENTQQNQPDDGIEEI